MKCSSAIRRTQAHATGRVKGRADGLDVDPPDVAGVAVGDDPPVSPPIERGAGLVTRWPNDNGGGADRVTSASRRPTACVLSSRAAAGTSLSRAERRSLGGIGSPVLRRVVAIVRVHPGTPSRRVIEQGNRPPRCLGTGSARVRVTSGTLVECRSPSKAFWRARWRRANSGARVHSGAPASWGAHGRRRCSAMARRATRHMTLRSGRTVKPGATFGASSSRAFGSTTGGPRGSDAFGGGAVGSAAADVDAASARGAFP